MGLYIIKGYVGKVPLKLLIVGCLGLDSMVKLLISLLFGGEKDWFCIFSLFAGLVGVYSGPTIGGAVQISGRGRAQLQPPLSAS